MGQGVTFAPRHRAQPDGLTCGPTCLAVLSDWLSRGTSALDVFHLASMCGTNATVGTTHEGVEVAFAGLGIDARRSLGEPSARRSLTEGIARGDAVLCRTLTDGVKHWTVATRATRAGAVRYLDPWLGESLRTVPQALALVAPREHETWLVPAGQVPPRVEVGPLVPEGTDPTVREALVSGVVRMAEPSFGAFVLDLRSYLDVTVDWGLSRAVRVDGNVVGAYLLDRGGLRPEVPTSIREGYEGLDGVEGVALIVDAAHRGKGYGRLLRDEPKRLGFDYVWGMQVKPLDNLDRWLRHRELVHDDGGCWHTARRFTETPRPAMGPA